MFRKMGMFVLGLGLSISLVACKKTKAESPSRIRKAPKVNQKAVPRKDAKPKKTIATQKAKLGTWKGYLIGKNTPRKFNMVMQHPLVLMPDDKKFKQTYFTLVKDGKFASQIITIFPKAKIPKDTSRPMEITGTSRTIGTVAKKAPQKRRRGKSSYRGTVVRVQSWKYISKL